MTDCDQPFVSVIIPVYNDARRLALCLEALAGQSYPAQAFEVIVIDNGSDQSPQAVVDRFAFSKLIVETRAGSYAARNTGLSAARGQVLAFTDADCLPRPQWLEQGVQRLITLGQGGVVAGHIELFCQDPDRPRGVELYDCMVSLDQQKKVERDQVAATGNLFTHRRVFDAVGLFDADLKSGGDAQWTQRAVAAGLPLVYSAEACIDHPARSSLGQMLRKKRRLVGGDEDLREPDTARRGVGRFFRVAWNSFVPRLWRYWKRSDDPRIKGLGQRLRLIGVLLAIQYATVWEKIRLRLGGKVERR